MKRKIISAVIAVIGVFCIISGFSIKSNGSDIKSIVNSAVYVKDGAVLPENEGKTVIVAGTVVPVEDLTDPVTGMTFNTIKLNRKVEQYSESYNSENERYEWNWKAVNFKTDTCPYFTETLYAKTKLGDFQLSNELLNPIAVNLEITGYDVASVSEKGWNVFNHTSRSYLSKSHQLAGDGWFETYKNEFAPYYNNTRIYYSVVDSSKATDVTVIGVQKNGTIQKSAELDAIPTHNGILTKAQMADAIEDSNNSGAFAAWVLGAIALAIAAFLFLKKGR